MSLSDSPFRFRRVVPKPVPEAEQLSIAHAGACLPVTFIRSARAGRASLRVDPAKRRIVLTAPLRMSRAMAVGVHRALVLVDTLVLAPQRQASASAHR